MLPELLLTMSAAAAASMYAGWRYTRRRMTEPAQPLQPFRMPGRPHFAEPSAVLEEVHVTANGPLALNSLGTTRVRPGHRCVDEVRRRIGSDFVGGLNYFEGQLNRRVSDDALEQSRFWIDMAEGMRGLNMHEALPALLRRADDALDLPLGEFYAAEVSAFAAFAEYLHDPLTPEGQAALRILRVAMEGVRCGRIPVVTYSEAAYGDAVRRLAENCPDDANPRLILVFIEAMRHCRRQFHIRNAFRDEPVRRQTVRWQHAFLKDAEPVMREYLHDIGSELVRMLATTHGRARYEILKAIDELRVDAGDLPLRLLGEAEFTFRPLAIRVLRWSTAANVLPTLCGIVQHAITGERSARWLRKLGIGKQELATEELLAVLHALKGHPSLEAEKVLLACAHHSNPEWRRGAIRSLCWWEPMRRPEVEQLLRSSRQDGDAEIRKVALAAAARLGECASIQMIRETLIRENPKLAIDAVRMCAEEGLSWLWPELDVVTEAEDPTVAAEAWESVERMREEFMGVL